MMGTVGLSFGAPTSGSGFDVSATVSQIVTNLQKVETPWKNQLNSLQSQDTAISNLGTLYSNLSKDIGQLTDFNGILAQKTGSSSDSNVLQLTSATSSAVAGTHTILVHKLAQTSSGYLTEIPSASDTLTGSITLSVGTGKAQTIALPSGGGTLTSLAAAINASGVGVRASVLTDSSGSRLSLVSGTSGAKGNLSITANSINDTTGITLQYEGSAGSGTSASSGMLTSIANAADVLSGTLSIQVGTGSPTSFTLDSSSNTLATLASTINQAAIGVTASVVTNGDGSSSLSLLSGTPGVEGTLAVTSSIVDSSPSLGYTPSVTGSDASLTIDGVNLTSASNTVASLIPGLTFQLLSSSPQQSDGSLEPVQVVIGNDNAGVETAFNSLVTDYNALLSAMNAQEGNDSEGKPEPLFGSPTLSLLQQQLLSSLNAPNPNGSLDAVSANTNTTLSGKFSITVGGGAQQEIDVPASPDNTIDGLAKALNAANVGVTANVVTRNGQSNLMLQSQKTGAPGALSVVAQIVATSDTPLVYNGTSGSSTSRSSGSLTSVADGSDGLIGSIRIQVGGGAAQTISLGSAGGTLQDLADAINSASGIGATASVSSDGKTLTLVSQTSGSAGTLSVTSSVLDTTNTATTDLNYSTASDLTALTALGISMNNDGSLAFDAATLDSLLNSDFNGVVGLFQGINSWGVNFSTMVNGAGTSSSTGILKLAQNSNSNVESTLNAEIAKEEALVAARQKSLTAELNQANEILQALPSQLDGINQIYSAITGYNQSRNG
jgi:flagellar hook-associated protein 2